MPADRSSLRRLARLGAAGAAALAFAAAPATSAPARAPSDPGWSQEWGARLVRLPAAWAVTHGSPAVVIATVDTGITEVSDLRGALVPGWDFVDGDAVAEDSQGHGTAVATAIAGRGDNRTGGAGACWECLLMPVRVADRQGAPAGLVAEGIRWAVDHGARIVNVSLTADGPDPDEADAVAYAVAHGVLVVASAGNTSGDAPEYPAALPGVLAVAGTDQDDVLYPWSTRGSWVSLAAPGCAVVSSIPAGWGTLCGSSVAPATVAGIAGLILSLEPSLPLDELVSALERSAVPVEGIGGGRVDAYGALALLGLAPPQPVPPFSPQSVIETGVLPASLALALDTGSGPLRAELRSPLAGRCSASLVGPDGALAVAATQPGVLVLDTRVEEGRQRLSFDCPASPAQPFTLVIRALLPTG